MCGGLNLLGKALNKKEGIGMKKITSILLAVLMLFSMFAVSVSAAPSLSLTVSDTAPDVGDTITVTAKISANSNLVCVDGKLTYNTEYFEYVSNSSSMGGTVNPKSGVVILAYAADIGKEYNGSELMTVTFKVLKTGGTLSFSTSGVYVLENGEDTPVSLGSKSVTLSAPSCKHANTTTEVTKEATCKAEGKKVIKCKDCGETIKTETIKKLSHKLGSYTVTKEPTCSATGTKTATCSVCGEKVTETIAKKTTHNFDTTKEKVTKEPTCTTEGTKSTYCKDCKKYIANGTIPATGHVYEVVTEKVDPTCTTAGKEVGKCKTCDETAETIIPATGHTYGEWVVTKEATSESEGKKERTCSTCNEVETQKIQKLPAEKDADEDEKDEDKDGISPLVIIIPVAIAAAAGLALAIIMIVRKKKEEV